MGTTLLSRRAMLPVVKSAPRACCAFMILSVSSRSVGTKRSAIVIIIASSCAGTPTRLSGESSASSASVSFSGLVVNVSSDESSRSSTRRRQMKKPCESPSQVRENSQTCAISSPGVVQRWMRNVKSRIHQSGFSEPTSVRSGTRESCMAASVRRLITR